MLAYPAKKISSLVLYQSSASSLPFVVLICNLRALRDCFLFMYSSNFSTDFIVTALDTIFRFSIWCWRLSRIWPNCFSKGAHCTVAKISRAFGPDTFQFELLMKRTDIPTLVVAFVQVSSACISTEGKYICVYRDQGLLVFFSTLFSSIYQVSHLMQPWLFEIDAIVNT